MMKFNEKCFFFVFSLSTFYLPLIVARPTPREALSLGGNGRKLILIGLNKIPAAAFARVPIGDPPKLQELHIDTGSDLTWVVHNPGSGYDPKVSSSFSYRSCDGLSKSRSVTPSRTNGQCDFKVRLADKAMYKGTLGNETFMFGTGEGGLGMLKNVLFGFGKTYGGQQAGNGTLGLKLGELSILQSFGGKFSICIGNFNDILGEKNFLAFGDDAVFSGSKISLDTKERTYKINLTSMIFDGEILDIQTYLWKSKSILDTGTSTLSLVPAVYNVVVAKITNKMKAEGFKDLYMAGGLVCHDGRITKLVDLGLHLIFGKVALKVFTMALFNQIDKYHFCLSVGVSPININLIGITVFQNHNIGFDVPNSKLYIKRVECNTLFDNYKDELGYSGP